MFQVAEMILAYEAFGEVCHQAGALSGGGGLSDRIDFLKCGELSGVGGHCHEQDKGTGLGRTMLRN